ncbi:MAG: hypothetical protein BAJALOKI3v1_70087 [Promethearchaeota archaeon]|nr:MAG: hypothetical protein BAJALOKI3v1_70087 [Candidatus Lokiarchaeota archaeon]
MIEEIDLKFGNNKKEGINSVFVGTYAFFILPNKLKAQKFYFLEKML